MKLLAAGVLLAQASSLAWSQPSSNTLESIVVTADRKQSTLRDVPASIFAVGGDDIKKIRPTHINELLARVPGTWISRGNGQESLTAIRSPVLAGAGACGAFLILEDGTPIRPVGFCNVNQLFDANLLQAGRVEVLKGPGAVVFGSNALHGIINVVSATLSIGGTVEFVASFSVDDIFSRFLKGDINVFMAVPTIYFKLIAAFELLDVEAKEQLKNAMKKFRLMVCGSAALPVSVMQQWEQVSGHVLLERYGMTEIGMGISNPYNGLRKPGAIGMPLPGVSVRLVDENMQPVINGEAGEIQIKGENVFKEYWNKPDTTAKEFTSDGWFKTGDVAVVEEGYYRILGRSSVDIIKSGGYKLSALEIEEVLRSHDLVDDCAVVGIADEEWGELVVAAVVAKAGLEQHQLNQWMRTQMPTYKTPRKYLLVKELPRNAMGKVVKNEVKTMFQ
mgnify:CR=1 FL=1